MIEDTTPFRYEIDTTKIILYHGLIDIDIDVFDINGVEIFRIEN